MHNRSTPRLRRSYSDIGHYLLNRSTPRRLRRSYEYSQLRCGPVRYLLSARRSRHTCKSKPALPSPRSPARHRQWAVLFFARGPARVSFARRAAERPKPESAQNQRRAGAAVCPARLCGPRRRPTTAARRRTCCRRAAPAGLRRWRSVDTRREVLSSRCRIHRPAARPAQDTPRQWLTTRTRCSRARSLAPPSRTRLRRARSARVASS